jgi:hypothetical protein
MRLPIILSGLLVVACSPREIAALPDDRLPQAALAAFQRHVETLGDGTLTCSAAAIEAAPRATGFINDDLTPDYAIDTGRISCQASGDAAPTAYFCGLYTCAFPALISNGDDWRVVPLMSGNEIEVRTVYQSTHFQVRQVNFGDPGGDTVVVREYAWRDGELVRVTERSEQVAASR